MVVKTDSLLSGTAVQKRRETHTQGTSAHKPNEKYPVHAKKQEEIARSAKMRIATQATACCIHAALHALNVRWTVTGEL